MTERKGNLASLLEMERAEALSLEVARAREQKLMDALLANDGTPAEERDDEWWAKWWNLDARYQYAVAYRKRIELTGRPHFCPEHKPEGVTDYELRDCDRCATEEVGQIADGLARKWREQRD